MCKSLPDGLAVILSDDPLAGDKRRMVVSRGLGHNQAVERVLRPSGIQGFPRDSGERNRAKRDSEIRIQISVDFLRVHADSFAPE